MQVKSGGREIGSSELAVVLVVVDVLVLSKECITAYALIIPSWCSGLIQSQDFKGQVESWLCEAQPMVRFQLYSINIRQVQLVRKERRRAKPELDMSYQSNGKSACITIRSGE